VLSCKDATRRMSEAEDRDLGLGERLELGMHLAMCKGCRNYQQHLHVLRDACRGYREHLQGTDVDVSPPEQKGDMR
jgi:hypothetical protein